MTAQRARAGRSRAAQAKNAAADASAGARAGRHRTPPPAHPAAGALALAVAALAIAALAVYHGALGYFFAQDDFAGLARATGLMPRLQAPWRWVSGQLYFDVMHARFGLHAAPYHAASLVAHALASVLVFAGLCGCVAAPAAWLGAAFFATHAAPYTAIYSISGIGEILALVFALAALLLARARGSMRWLALPAFALSLLCKESTALLPLVVALDPARRAARARDGGGRRDPVPWALAALAAACVGAFLAADPFRLRVRLDAAQPYAWGADVVLPNLLTYAAWTANAFYPTVHDFADATERGVSVAALLAIACAAAALAWRPARERGAVWGVATWLAFLLPVLALRNHTYHYYLYAPLAGAAAVIAAAAGAWLARGAMARRGTTAGAWLVAAVLGAVLTLNGALLVREIETHPFVDPALRADPTVDRARIALHVRDDLAAAALPRGTRLVFWSPLARARQAQAGGDPAAESYWEKNVRGALLDGLAVRVMFPAVDSVRFATNEPEIAPAVRDARVARVALYAIDGRLRVVTPGMLDTLVRMSSGATP